MFLEKLKENILPLEIFFLTFLIYLHHLSSSVYGGDAGDFLSAIAVRGVAHPPGYPLYTMLGILASFLPFHQTLAWKVDLLSAFFSSFAVVVMYKIVEELLKNKFLAAITSLTLAFVFPFWLFAEIAEVFALHTFFLLLLFYLALLVYTKKRVRDLYLLALCTGLSFSNQHMTAFLGPSLIVFFIIAIRKGLPISFTIIGKCLGLFLIGLLPYLYITIAASHNPPINWDHASNLQNFIRLITRADYGYATMRGHINILMRIFSVQEYFSYIIATCSLLIVGLSCFGIVGLVRKKQFVILSTIFLAFFFFGIVFSWIAGSINLDRFSYGMSEKFYLDSLPFLILLMPFGIAYLAEFLKRGITLGQSDHAGRFVEKVTIGIFALIPVWLFFSNISTTDLHTNQIGDTFGKDILIHLPKNSYVVAETLGGYLGSIDDAIGNSKYMRYAKGVRPDVSVMTKAEFIEFEHGGTPNRPVFITVKEFAGVDPKEIATITPYGLLFLKQANNELSREEYIHMQDTILKQLAKSSQAMPSSESLSKLQSIADIPLWYARAFANTGSYLIYKYQDFETAKKYFQKALIIDPQTEIAYEGLGDYAFYKDDCKTAAAMYEKAAEIEFLNKRFYQKLYRIFTDCLHDTEKAQDLRDFFSENKSLFGDIK